MAVKRWSIIDEQYPTPWKRRDFLLPLFLSSIDHHRMRWSLRSLCIYVRVHMPCTRKINSHERACMPLHMDKHILPYMNDERAWIGLMITDAHCRTTMMSSVRASTERVYYRTQWHMYTMTRFKGDAWQRESERKKGREKKKERKMEGVKENTRCQYRETGKRKPVPVYVWERERESKRNEWSDTCSLLCRTVVNWARLPPFPVEHLYIYSQVEKQSWWAMKLAVRCGNWNEP